jgi:DNA-binding protein HU-beta
MNKPQLVNAIANDAEITQAEAGRALNALLETVTEALRKGDTVTLVGFGTFSVSARPERVGRNPSTGEAITIAAANKPTFKPGKALKEAVN